MSSPVTGGGYPGAEPAPGACVRGRYDTNFSQGALALRPGTERLVGASKAFFLGDYFSMQISRSRVSILSASTHPPSSVRGDDGRGVHYQQQVLTTFRRSVLGLVG